MLDGHPITYDRDVEFSSFSSQDSPEVNPGEQLVRYSKVLFVRDSYI